MPPCASRTSSSRWISAFGRSRRKVSAPAGPKISSLRPQVTSGRLVGPEVFLEGGVPVEVELVVPEQLQLDRVALRAVEAGLVELPGVRCDAVEAVSRDAVGVLPLCRLGLKQFPHTIFVGGSVLGVREQNVPEWGETLHVGVAALGDDGRHPVGGPAGDAQADRGAAVVVRPERIVLRSAGDDVPTGWNAVPATVTEQVYLGMGRLLVLHRSDGDRVTVREPAGRWSAATVGEEVVATWRAEDGVLLADDAGPERIHPRG